MFDFPVQKRRKSTVKYYVIAYQSKQRANTIEPELTYRPALDHGWRKKSVPVVFHRRPSGIARC